MGRATARYMAELRKSHTTYTYVDVIGPTGETQRLSVTDGEINVDRTAQYRRAGKINCIDPLGVLIPSGNNGILTPFGSEVRPYQGVRYDDGTVEVYPLGVFRISKTTVKESSTSGTDVGVSFEIEMFDRSWRISRDKFQTPYTLPATTNVVDAIKLIIGRTFPDADYDAIGTAVTTPAPQVFDMSNDPWEAVTSLAQSIGCEIYFNVDGWVVIAPPVDIDALPNPDFTYIEGQGCTMTDISSVYTADPGFNGVILTGASVGNELPPVRAESWDTEPSSPTYRFGPYGQVPQFITDQTVTTAAQAQAAADSLLKGLIGFSSQLTITAWTNSAFEAGEVVQVERAKLNVTGLYALDAFTIPLKKDNTQTITLRQKRTVG